MESETKCKEHGNGTKVICAKCECLVCQDCLPLHEKQGCPYPTNILSYGAEQLLPKYKAKLDEFEKQKGTIEGSAKTFYDFLTKITRDIKQLQEILERILDSIEYSKGLIDEDTPESYYEVIRQNQINEIEDLKEAVNNKNIEHIIKKKNELKEDVIGFNEGELIKAANNSITKLLKSPELALIDQSFQKFCQKHKQFLREDEFTIPSKFLYGICEPQAERKILCRYDVKERKMMPTIFLPHKCTVTQIGQRIFISGGCDPPTNTVTEFIEDMQSLMPKMPMNYPKYLHRAQPISANAFITIGGCHRSAALGHCERYSIEMNRWEMLPSLNKPRYSPATFLQDGRYLYVLGGYGSGNSIEKLDIKEEKGWEFVGVVSNELRFDFNPIAFLTSNNKVIIICGGGTNQTAVYDLKYKTIKKIESILASDNYHDNNICSIGRSVYTMSYSGNIVSYNLNSRKFEEVTYSNAYP